MKSRSEYLIEWVFALVSVAVVWNLDLSLGARPDSFFYKLIVDGGVPVLLTLIAMVALQLYGRVVWPLWPWSRCQRGWWVYGLAVRDNPEIKVVGYFFLDDRIEGASISEGRAFYVEDTGLVYRGDWSAHRVFVESYSLGGFFLWIAWRLRESLSLRSMRVILK